MFVNKAIIQANDAPNQAQLKGGCQTHPRRGGETLAPVFTHKTNEFILSTKNYAIVKKGSKIIQVDRYNFKLRSAHGNVQV